MVRSQDTTAELTPTERYVCGILDGLIVVMAIAIVLLVAL
jgi:hypothetical protein